MAYDPNDPENFFGLAPVASHRDYIPRDPRFARQMYDDAKDQPQDPLSHLLGEDPAFDAWHKSRQNQKIVDGASLRSIDPTTDDGELALMQTLGRNPELLAHPEIKSLAGIASQASHRREVMDYRKTNAENRQDMKQQALQLQQDRADKMEEERQRKIEMTDTSKVAHNAMGDLLDIDPRDTDAKDRYRAALKAARESGALGVPGILGEFQKINQLIFNGSRPDRDASIPAHIATEHSNAWLAANTKPSDQDKIDYWLASTGQPEAAKEADYKVAAGKMKKQDWDNAYNSIVGAKVDRYQKLSKYADAFRKGLNPEVDFNPGAPPAETPVQAPMTVITTQAAYDALPKGAAYTDANGKKYLKR